MLFKSKCHEYLVRQYDIDINSSVAECESVHIYGSYEPVQTLTLWLTVALNENLLHENMLLSLMMEIKVAPNESYKLGWIKDNAFESNVFLSLMLLISSGKDLILWES